MKTISLGVCSLWQPGRTVWVFLFAYTLEICHMSLAMTRLKVIVCFCSYPYRHHSVFTQACNHSNGAVNIPHAKYTSPTQFCATFMAFFLQCSEFIIQLQIRIRYALRHSFFLRLKMFRSISKFVFPVCVFFFFFWNFAKSLHQIRCY